MPVRYNSTAGTVASEPHCFRCSKTVHSMLPGVAPSPWACGSRWCGQRVLGHSAPPQGVAEPLSTRLGCVDLSPDQPRRGWAGRRTPCVTAAHTRVTPPAWGLGREVIDRVLRFLFGELTAVVADELVVDCVR